MRKAVLFLIPYLFYSCAPPVHLNKGREKVVIPAGKKKEKKEKNETSKLHKKLSKEAKREVLQEIKAILNLQNGVNPSDLKPFNDNSIF